MRPILFNEAIDQSRSLRIIQGEKYIVKFHGQEHLATGEPGYLSFWVDFCRSYLGAFLGLGLTTVVPLLVVLALFTAILFFLFRNS